MEIAAALSAGSEGPYILRVEAVLAFHGVHRPDLAYRVADAGRRFLDGNLRDLAQAAAAQYATSAERAAKLSTMVEALPARLRFLWRGIEGEINKVPEGARRCVDSGYLIALAQKHDEMVARAVAAEDQKC